MQLSIVILNYNTAPLALRCLATIRQYLLESTYELIVIDNNSREEDYEILEEGVRSDGATLFRSRKNVGFGAGNMLGANFAKGKYICFINSDVELMEDCMTPLCAYLEAHPEVGCVTPQQYDSHRKPVPSFNHNPGIRHEILGKKFLETFFPAQYPRRKRILYTEPFAASQINGSFLLLPTRVFFEVGGFDTNIFLYYEEFDLCTRLRQHNYKSVVVPQYKFLHLHEASTTQTWTLSKRELYISKIYVYKKHRPYLLYLIYLGINLIKLLCKPKRWYILRTICRGEMLSHSMRHLF
ncbi:MAG TPA: glycosyltransferase family 2 protein [Bacteroidales bacterium]